MAKKKVTEDGTADYGKFPVSKGEPIDYSKTVTLRALDGAVHHEVGEEFEASIVLADKMVYDGTAELA